MNAHRKLRMGAVAVIINGLVALAAMAPSPAPAAADAACSDNNHVEVGEGPVCIECEPVPGCELVSDQCRCIGHSCQTGTITFCYYE